MSKLTMIFDAQTARAKAKLKDLGKSVKSAFSGMKGAVVGLGAAAGFAMSIGAVKSKIDELDNLSKNARGLNMTGEQLQVLSYACRSSNVDIETLKGSIPKMQKVIADAGAGSEQAADKLARLGLTAEDLKGKTSYEQLQMVAQALNGIPDPTERSAAAMDVLGKSSSKMLDMLSGLNAAADEARAQGVIISDENLKAAEAFNQALTNIHDNIVAGLVNSGFIKWLSDVAEGMNAIATNSKKMEKSGIFDRRRAANTVIDEAEKSGRIGKQEAGRLRQGVLAFEMGNDNRFTHASYAKIQQLLREGGFGGIANGADNQTRQQSKAERDAEVRKAQEDKAKREEAAKRQEDVRRAAAEKKQKEAEAKKAEQEGKERSALQDQLDALQGKGKKQTRQDFIDAEIKKAIKAAPTTWNDEMRKKVEQAAGDAYDRQDQDEADKKEMSGLQEELRNVGEQVATEYRGDAVRRIGGSLGGTRGADRMQQSQLKIQQNTLTSIQAIEKKIADLKLKNPNLFQ